jgi:hypothetical protein
VIGAARHLRLTKFQQSVIFTLTDDCKDVPISIRVFEYVMLGAVHNRSLRI